MYSLVESPNKRVPLKQTSLDDITNKVTSHFEGRRKMDQSYNSDSTYCSLVESPNKKVKLKKTKEFLDDITNKVKSHFEGAVLLGSQEVLKFHMQISNIKINSKKWKLQAERLKSVLSTIHKRNKTFEETICKSQKFIAIQKDSIINCGITQDLHMLSKNKNKLQPMPPLDTNDSKSLCFQTNMLSNQNFIDVTKESEITNSEIIYNIYPEVVPPLGYIELPDTLTNLSLVNSTKQSTNNSETKCVNKGIISSVESVQSTNFEISANHQSLLFSADVLSPLKGNATNLINKEKDQNLRQMPIATKNMTDINNIDSPSVNTNMSSNQNFISNSQEKSENFISNSLISGDENGAPSSTVDSIHILPMDKIEFSFNISKLSKYGDNSKTLSYSDNIPTIKEITQSHNKCTVVNKNLSSEDLFSTQNTYTLDPIKNNFNVPISTSEENKMDSLILKKEYSPTIANSRIGKCHLKPSLTSHTIDRSIEDSQSLNSEEISKLPRSGLCQKIISDSFCDKMDIDSNTSTDISKNRTREILNNSAIKGAFKTPSLIGKRNKSASSSNKVVSSSETPDEWGQKIPEKIILPESDSSAKRSDTMSSSCDNVCKLMGKFLKLTENSIVDGSAEYIDRVRNMANPATKKDFQEVAKFGTFLTKSYNKKINTLIYNIGTGSATWEDSTEKIEQTGQLREEISGLLVDILENANKCNEEFEMLEHKIANCFNPEDVVELDLKNLIRSNTLRLQHIFKSFVMEDLQPNPVDDKVTANDLSYFDWKVILN